MSVFQLIYLSRTTLLGATEQLAVLCEHWSRRNLERGLTGAVLFCNGYVLQLLEGAEPDVRNLYNVISRDPRHVDLRLIHAGEIEQRQFSDHLPTFLHLPGEAVNFNIVRQLTSRVNAILMTDKTLLKETRDLIRRFQASIVAGYEPSQARTTKCFCDSHDHGENRFTAIRGAMACRHCNSMAA